MIDPNPNLGIEILPSIETDMIIQYKDQLLKKQINEAKEEKSKINNNIKKMKNLIEEKSKR